MFVWLGDGGGETVKYEQYRAVWETEGRIADSQLYLYIYIG